jgi:threonine dehydratase
VARIDLLKRILNARVYEVARETELEQAPQLSARLANSVWLKREDNQPVFSFKLRGAYNKMVLLSKTERSRGIIAASAGNHAQGVALAAERLQCKAVIVMPVTTPSVKVDAVRAHGKHQVEIVLSGDSFTDAYNHALTLQAKHGYTFVHPFDDLDVIAGQGTVGMEILRQHQDHIDAVFVAIGGGGLIAGIGAYIKAVRPEIRVVGVQSVDSDAMARSLEAGKRVRLKHVGLFSDGTAVKEVGALTFRLAQQHVDEIVLVDTDDICAAIKDVFEDTRSILEPAGALAVAGLKSYVARNKIKNQTLIAVACGANMNFDRMRFVADRAEIGEDREAVFAVTIPEERGSFRRFCELLGERSVTEFNYRISDANTASLFVGVAIRARSEGARLASQFKRRGFATLDLSADDVAKEHLRYMVGGRSALAVNEMLYRFEFPERPGALMQFLNSLSPNWNITLFHYRNQGADYSSILVGMQVPPAERRDFVQFLKQLGYAATDESANPAYHLFLGQTAQP